MEWVVIYFAINTVILVYRRLLLSEGSWSLFVYGLVFFVGIFLEIIELISWIILKLRKRK